MISYWQEIVTFVIVAIAVWFLVKRYFLRKKSTLQSADGASHHCDTGTCDGCNSLTLKHDTMMTAGGSSGHTGSSPDKESKKSSSEKSEDAPGLIPTVPLEIKSEKSSSSEDGGEEAFRQQCRDACIQVRRMGLK